jgi:uncharacterized protein YkwD
MRWEGWLRLALSSVLLCLTALTTACAGDADPRSTSKALSDAGCGSRAANLAQSEALNDVAGKLASGARLQDALDRIGYPAAKAQSVYVQGPTDDAAIGDIIHDRLCAGADGAEFEEVGVFRRGDEAWIVLAKRTEQPKIEESATIAARVLELVNVARAQPRRCGKRRFAAVPRLTLSPILAEVASSHARDMAQHGTLDHRGSDGSTPDQRVSRAGYVWQAVGENVASGQPDADAAVTSWLDSPEHCMNIMSREFTQTGIAFALAPSQNPSVYWVQVFAAPQ